MEAFEQFAALHMETDGLVVSEAVKFPVTRETRRIVGTNTDGTPKREVQTHAYEVDLVGANSQRLVLATVKSYFGSKGVQAKDIVNGPNPRYALLNDPDIRPGVLAGAARRYHYEPEQVSLRLYVGKFANPTKGDEAAIRDWGKRNGVEVYGLTNTAALVRKVAASKTYRDNPVIVTFKVLEAAGLLAPGVAAAEDPQEA